jgi:hypothetical protein
VILMTEKIAHTEKKMTIGEKAKAFIKEIKANIREDLAKGRIIRSATAKLKKMKLSEDEMLGARIALVGLDGVGVKSTLKWWKSPEDCKETVRAMTANLEFERDFGENGPLIDGAKKAFDVVQKIVSEGATSDREKFFRSREAFRSVRAP